MLDTAAGIAENVGRPLLIVVAEKKLAIGDSIRNTADTNLSVAFASRQGALYGNSFTQRQLERFDTTYLGTAFGCDDFVNGDRVRQMIIKYISLCRGDQRKYNSKAQAPKEFFEHNFI